MLETYKTQLDYSRGYIKGVIYENKRENLDSLIFHISKTFVHYKMNSEYINLKYSGRLNLIANDTLRYNLVRFYEGIYTVYDELAENHKKFAFDYLQDYCQEAFPSDTSGLVNPSLIFRKLEDEKFRNLIIDQLNFYGTLNRYIQIEEIELLNEMVRKELEL